MPDSTFHEWASTRAYARVRVLLVACISISGLQISYAQTVTAGATPPALISATDVSRAENRFAEGMALVAANDTASAIEVFVRLTQEYPRLPEPHVQLAALYVKQGDHRKALATLRTALALRADDARLQTALGDVYAMLAARAYRAATAAGAATDVQQKLDTLEQLEHRTRTEATESP